MLSERAYRALSAFVDGELTPRQRKAVLRLVRRSAEARKCLRQLREDSSRLKSLPRKRLRHDFADQVLKTIAQRRLDQRRTPALRPRPWHAMPLWGGLAAAASVLLMIGFSAYLAFLNATSPDVAGPAAATTGKGGDQAADSTPQGKDSTPIVQGNGSLPDREPGQESNTVAQGTQNGPENPPLVPVESLPEEDNRVAAPVPRMELFGPHTADVSLPEVQRLAQLDPSKLRDLFQKDTGFRVELPCLNSVKAFERLQASFKTRGVNLLLDEAVQKRLKQAHLHTNFVVFVEDLSSEDLVKLLEQVAADDMKTAAKTKSEPAFDGLIVTRMDQDDRKELGDLLGIDSRQVQTPRPTGPLGLDPRTPIAEVTAHQVIQSLTAGQGTSPRGNEPARVDNKKPEQRGVLLPFNPVRLRPGSVEVKKFLDGRKPLRSGAVQVLLVVREVKG